MNKQKQIQVSDLKPMWFPEPYQVSTLPNPNYLNSLWIGLTNPLWNLPTMLWILILRPVLVGVVGIVAFTLRCTIAGVLGRATGLPVAFGCPDE